MRLGFPVRIYGSPHLPSHDGRPAHQRPQLSLSLAYVRDILLYLQGHGIHMYRLDAGLIPGALQRTWPDTQEELRACAAQLRSVGALARSADVRLSVHAHSAVVLNAPNEDQVLQSAVLLQAYAALLDAMGLGPEAVIVIHAGGVYGDPEGARARFLQRYALLPAEVRARLVLEHDDRRFGVEDALQLHEACGIPIVFDHQHHLVLNPGDMPVHSALERCLTTWPAGIKPKIHYSTPCAAMRDLASGHYKVPTWTEHADFVNPFEFAAFVRQVSSLPPFDVMLEAKGRDLALLKLRQDLARYALDVTAQID
ncbi:MAG: UV DNA damage repair endonuclease UvsE [Anaerolineae bacterium]|nr:UV DNA damage repair endonuclease UvsE [Anaerolineae bacterium]